MSALAPDAVGMGPPGAGGPPPGAGDPASMAALAAALGAGGPGNGAPDLGDGLPGGPPPDPTAGGGDQQGTDLLNGMSTTDHIRAAIKHLMMAMTESSDDTESHGIGKGMAGLQAILAAKQKDAKTLAAAGG